MASPKPAWFTLTIINQSLFLPNLHSPNKIGFHDSKEKKSKTEFTTSYGSIATGSDSGSGSDSASGGYNIVQSSPLTTNWFNNHHNHNHRLKKTEKFLLQCRRRKIHTIHKASRVKQLEVIAATERPTTRVRLRVTVPTVVSVLREWERVRGSKVAKWGTLRV